MSGRYNYFPSAKRFVLRMAEWLHESFASYVEEEILRQLGTIAQSESPSAEFERDIRNLKSPKIRFQDAEYGPHYPDAAFLHIEAQYPGVIIEILLTEEEGSSTFSR